MGFVCRDEIKIEVFKKNMYNNTFIYLALLLVAGLAVVRCSFRLKFVLFIVVYFTLFILLELVDLYTDVQIWSQVERTEECYDWFQHYLKKDYGVIDGKHVFDYSENIYLDDFDTPTEKALQNKYELMFSELNLSSGKRLLDCGCGIGTWMLYCQERGVEVIGLTLSNEQRIVCEKRGLKVYVQDYRKLNQDFTGQFDAVSLFGSTEHVSVLSKLGTMTERSYEDYKSLFHVLQQYLKKNGRILLTVLVQCKPKSDWTFMDYVQSYILQRHYGGYYSKTDVISNAITDNGFTIDSVKDYTKDYHWISVAEPDHFGHWCVRWNEDPIDKILYFFKGLATDPFLLHHWLYYGLDSWMYQLGGYQTKPLSDTQVEHAVANLKYFSISI